MDDLTIVDLYKNRDEQAIHETQLKYGGKLLSLARRVLFDLHAAEECVNDTYLKTWNSIPPNDPGTYFFPYIAKILRGLAIDRYRKDKSEREKAEIVELTEELDAVLEGVNPIEGMMEAKDLNRTINAFLRKLPAEKRNIFIRRYWFMDSVEEIANRYNLTEGKVKTVLFRLRNDLKSILTKEGYFE